MVLFETGSPRNAWVACTAASTELEQPLNRHKVAIKVFIPMRCGVYSVAHCMCMFPRQVVYVTPKKLTPLHVCGYLNQYLQMLLDFSWWNILELWSKYHKILFWINVCFLRNLVWSTWWLLMTWSWRLVASKVLVLDIFIFLNENM